MGSKTLKKASETSNLNASVSSSSATGPIPGDGLAFRATKADLKRAITLLATVAEKRSTMPILMCVKIIAADSVVTMTATDLDVSASVTLPARDVRGGSAVVNAKQLADTVKTMADGDVTLAMGTGTSITLSHGGTKANVSGYASRDYPKTPAIPPYTAVDADKRSPVEISEWHYADGDEWHAMIDSVDYAICKDDTRFHLNGVYIETSDDVIRMVATDGHRLTKVERWNGSSLRCPKGLILPAKASKIIGKALKKQPKVEIAIKAPHVFVRVGETTIAAKCIDAQFPAYEQVIPNSDKSTLTVNVQALTSAIERAKVAATETRGIALKLAAGKVTVEGSNPDTGDIVETLDAECTFPRDHWAFAIGANPKYLLDALAGIDDDVVVLSFENELDPILVMSQDDRIMSEIRKPRYLGVVMPMRI
jgi:DNA polymerase-3 subunit beta